MESELNVTVGRIVHVVYPGVKGPLAAIVTEISEQGIEGAISCTIFLPAMLRGQALLNHDERWSHVPYDADGIRPISWRWPPRVGTR